jgi:hypothetical protein
MAKKQDKFDSQEPEQYSVTYEDRVGDVGQTKPVSYAETDKVRTSLEISGVRVTGVVKNPKK